MDKISVALCTYNGAHFLGEQLDSLARQKQLPDELIIGDDQSTDATLKILEDFAARAPFPVRIHVNKVNLGSTRNFEQTILRCDGEIIFLCDQDDVWLPQKIAKAMSEFEKKPNVGLVFSDAEIVDEKLKPYNVKLSDLTFALEIREAVAKTGFLPFLFYRNYVTGATLAFRSKFRKSFLPFPDDVPEMIHDAWLAFVIVANADFKFIDEPLIKYRQHERQQLGIFVKKDLSEVSRNQKYQNSIALHNLEKDRVNKIMRCVNERRQQFENLTEIEKLASKILAEIEEKLLHYETRKNLPNAKLARIAPIAREVLSGRYRRLSQGSLSAFKDLLEHFE